MRGTAAGWAVRALRIAGWALLGAIACAGLALSLVALLAALPVTRPLVARAVIDAVSARIAGRLELEGIAVLPHGGLELRRLRVIDPDGHLVLAVERALVSADATALRSRQVGVALELDRPSVLLEEERDGGVSIGRAFAPRPGGGGGAGSAGGSAGEDGGGGGSGGGFTLEITRLALRGGDLWWVDREGRTRLEASSIDAEARGALSAARSRAELRLRAEVASPVRTPVELEVAATLAGSSLEVPILRVDAAGSTLALTGTADLTWRAARVAVERLAVSRAGARSLLPRLPAGEDLGARGYLESDGDTVSAALRVDAAAGRGGSADAAVAARLDAVARAAGLDLALDRLDPSRLVAGWPEGAVTLTARGAAAGTSARDLRGAAVVSVRGSRLGGGTVTRADAAVRAGRGALTLERLEAAGPGVSLRGAGRWSSAGPVAATVSVDLSDLGAAARNVAALAGRAAPPASGRARLDATLSGTAQAPALEAHLVAPALRYGALEAERVRLTAREAGPRGGALAAAVEGTAGVLREGGGERARDLAVRATLAGDDLTLAARALVPEAGKDAVALDARARLERDRDTLQLAELALALPGGRWSLAHPATIALRGPRVDRLELESGAQRVVAEGGVAAGGALAATVELSALDLAHLPPPLLAGHPVAGLLSGHVDLGGSTARPTAAGRLALERGAYRELTGLTAIVDGRWSGATRRVSGTISVARQAGGALDGDVELPLPLAGRRAEAVRGHLRAEGLPLEELLATAGSDLPARGTAALELRLAGTAGAPALAGEISVRDGAWADLDGIGVTVALDAPGASAHALVTATLAGRAVAMAEAAVPLDLGALAAAPARALRAARDAPLRATVALTELDLTGIAGRLELPPELEGVLGGRAEVTGSLAAPRGTALLDVAGGGARGVHGVDAHLAAAAAASGFSLTVRAALGGEDALRVQASLGIAPERLGDRAALRDAPLQAEVVVPRLDAGRALPGMAPLAGTVAGRATVSGSPGAPVVDGELSGTGVALERRPLGDASARVRYADGRGRAEADLRPLAGGTLHATLAVAAALGLDASGPPLRDAPADATVVARALDLGFLPAAARGTFRSAAGKLDLDLAASGPLARLRPRGTVHLANGRVAIVELGEWTDLALELKVTGDAVELSRLEARRGKGRLSVNGSLRGLTRPGAKLDARVSASSVPLTSAGMPVATVSVEATASGTYRDGVLDVSLDVPRGLVWLPSKQPRTLQSLEPRRDVVVGRRAERKEERQAASGGTGGAGGSAGAEEGGEKPLALRIHAVAPRAFFVKSDDPRVDLELKADVHYERDAGDTYLSGTVEVVQGTIEPIGGRNFVVDRGVVQFTGGPPSAALLDVNARYANPVAQVTVKVLGTVRKPEVKLSSEPPLDDSQIALLIATGRTDLKPGGANNVGTISGGEAGMAALGAVATQAFRNIVQNKLPVDSVALEPGALRAGKYVTDKIYVGYVLRWDADPTKNQNADEVRVDYQITPRWIFESRYGNAQTGGASLIWSKDY